MVVVAQARAVLEPRAVLGQEEVHRERRVEVLSCRVANRDIAYRRRVVPIDDRVVLRPLDDLGGTMACS